MNMNAHVGRDRRGLLLEFADEVAVAVVGTVGALVDRELVALLFGADVRFVRLQSREVESARNKALQEWMCCDDDRRVEVLICWARYGVHDLLCA